MDATRTAAVPNIPATSTLQRPLLEPADLLVQGCHPSLSLLHRVSVHHERLRVGDNLKRVHPCGQVSHPGFGNKDHSAPRPKVPLLGEVGDDVIFQDEPASPPLHATLSVSELVSRPGVR